MQSLLIPVTNRSPHPLPQYATPGAAGLDLHAWLEEDVILGPLQRHLFPTGISIELPEGYEAQVRPRSGLALKHGIGMVNAPGTIDSDYRGELGVLLVNLSSEPMRFTNGMRIAQLVIAKVEKAEWKLVDRLNESKRGAGGYGSSGV